MRVAIAKILKNAAAGEDWLAIELRGMGDGRVVEFDGDVSHVCPCP
jgi:hypothetical protein